MPDSALADLTARVARLEAAVGITPPEPAPPPAGGPAKPTGLKCVIGADGRPDLRWDSAAGVTAWEVHDLANPGKTLQATVTEPRSIRAALKPGQRRRYAVLAVGPGGRSGMSDPIDVPPASADTPSPPPPPAPGTGSGDAPGAVLDLTRWYLTLPVSPPAGDEDTSGPWDVYQPRLATFSHELFRGGSDQHGRYVEYVCPASGPGVTTTSAESGAARCELREMTGPNRSDKAAWGWEDGRDHVLTCTLTCDGTSISGRKEVIVGQVHGPGTSPPVLICLNHTRGALELFKQGPRAGDLLTGVKPGQLLTYRIAVRAGRCAVSASFGDVSALPSTPQFDFPASAFTERTGLYGKAGAYLKEKLSTSASGKATVRHYRLDLT